MIFFYNSSCTGPIDLSVLTTGGKTGRKGIASVWRCVGNRPAAEGRMSYTDPDILSRLACPVALGIPMQAVATR